MAYVLPYSIQIKKIEEGLDNRNGCQRLFDTMLGPGRESLLDLHKEVHYSDEDPSSSSSSDPSSEGDLLLDVAN
jgi:hypothetical protein